MGCHLVRFEKEAISVPFPSKSNPICFLLYKSRQCKGEVRVSRRGQTKHTQDCGCFVQYPSLFHVPPFFRFPAGFGGKASTVQLFSLYSRANWGQSRIDRHQSSPLDEAGKGDSDSFQLPDNTTTAVRGVTFSRRCRHFHTFSVWGNKYTFLKMWNWNVL